MEKLASIKTSLAENKRSHQLQYRSNLMNGHQRHLSMEDYTQIKGSNAYGAPTPADIRKQFMPSDLNLPPTVPSQYDLNELLNRRPSRQARQSHEQSNRDGYSNVLASVD
jgi:hypothetical protein